MYLKTLEIKNFRGIEHLTISFDSKINVIIGPNASCKTAVIDAMRLFFQLGDSELENRLVVREEDFHRQKVQVNENKIIYNRLEPIDLIYLFDGLEGTQLGAYNDYEYIDTDGKMKARVHLSYALNNGKVVMSLNSGHQSSEKHPDPNSLSLFCHYYLEPLRDSTRRLLSTKNNLLGKVISRKITQNPNAEDTEKKYKDIIAKANEELLKQREVLDTKQGINDNLKNILKGEEYKVDLKIEQDKVEYIVNVIKPYLPKGNDKDFEGFKLWQNSLGYNNLIYIATVLSDIKDCHNDDPDSLYVLLIEEPEAHLHPQLQVNLYNFLLDATKDSNSQVFITTHSPTLTSKVPFENLILLRDNAYLINNCFIDRVKEKIKYSGDTHFTDNSILKFKKMLMRYLDVTRSQLFFSQGCLLVEGVSEALMINKFAELKGKSLSDSQVEIVNLEGTAFVQFVLLFNSSDATKRLPMKLAIITDADQFTDSKKAEWNLEELIKDNYAKLNILREKITNEPKIGRVQNLNNASNAQNNIKICDGDKTLEYQICLANVCSKKSEIITSSLYAYLKREAADNISKVETYIKTLDDDKELPFKEQQNIAILLWKSMPSKSDFAQGFIDYLDELSYKKEQILFSIPPYISEAIDFLTK